MLPDVGGAGRTDARPDGLPRSRRLVAAGLGRWRGEAFDVRADPDGPVLGQVDRGALPVLGIEAVGVHLNGLVERPDGLHCGSPAARRTRSSTRASWTTSSPAACRPASTRRRRC